MPVSADMLAHLASNVTTICALWKIVATDGTVAAYCAHTRPLVFNAVTYAAAQVEPSTLSQKIGLQSNTIELFGIFDSTITESDVQGGRWKSAAVTFEYVNYLDLTMGSVGKQRGRVGNIEIENGTYRMEVRSLAELLQQEIGDLTSPIDRNRQLTDLVGDVTAYTFARTVSLVTDRFRFTVDGAAQVDNYFAYGKVTFTSGANNGRSMEIKSSTGNAIELQLPMLSTVTIGDTVSLLAGYDGTRTQARDKFNAMENFRGEPDLPGLRGILEYPE